MSKNIVLVISDNRQITDFLAENALPSLGYKALVANSNQVGLDILREKHQQINLIIIDLQMPYPGGLDLLRKSTKEGINVPAILMTTVHSEKMAVEALRLGVHDYLIKPINIVELNKTISRVLAISQLKSEKKSLANQLQQQVSWLTALSDVGQSVTSTLDLNTVLSRIVEAGVNLTSADQGFIALTEPGSDKLAIRVVKNIEKEKTDRIQLPVDDNLIGQVLKTNRPVRKSQSDEKKLYKVSTGLLVHDLIHVPISYKQQVIGVLSVNIYQQQRSFTNEDETMLTSLADYAAIAIENANSFAQAQREIEERERISKALRKSEERYALAVRGSNAGLWDWDLNSDYIYYSPRWKEIFGYNEKEISNKPDEWFQRVKLEDLEQLKRNISLHIHRQTSHFENEHRILHKDGSYRHVLCRGTAVFNEAGEAVRLAGSIDDITERKYAEEKLQEYSERLEEMVEERTQELQKTQKQLIRKERLAALGQFAGGIAHELRGPLSVIFNLSYLLKTTIKDKSEDVNEYLSMLDEEIKHARNIINDLLEFARTGEKKQVAVSIPELIGDMFGKNPPPEGITNETHFSNDLPLAYGDPNHIHQVLTNLVKNAYEAMPNGGQLLVNGQVLKSDSQLQITVKDTGTGIPPENLEKIFEPLFTTKERGIGLGLALSKTLVEANQGRIEVESEVDVGTVFRVILPVFKE